MVKNKYLTDLNLDFNRTIKELKSASLKKWNGAGLHFNRTIKELK